MRKALSIFCLAAVVGLAGCGGSGGHNAFSPFAGNWSGNFIVTGAPTELMSLSISSHGDITGTETLGTSTTADTGVVQENGDFNILSRLAGTPDARLIGSMFIGNDGLLHGDGTETQSGNHFTFSFDLNAQ